jgi:hypothetical protein
MSRSQQRSVGTWVFGLLFAIFLIGVFIFAPASLPPFKQRILAITAALLAGCLGYFLTGTIGLNLKTLRIPFFGEVAANATGGIALFVLVLWWWLSPLAPVAPATTGLVAVRATVLGPDGMPINGARVWSSVGGETQKVPGGWEIEIPESKIPKDKKVDIYTTKKKDSLSGHKKVEVDAPYIPIKIYLTRNTTDGPVENRLDSEREDGPVFVYVLHKQLLEFGKKVQ